MERHTAGPGRTYDAATLAASDVLRLLRDGPPRTRAELGEQLGLARATVALRIEPLLRAGIVGAVTERPSTGGRPPGTLGIVASARLVLAVDLGATRGRVALTDLGGQLLASTGLDVAVTAGPAAVLDRVLEAARSLLGQVRRPASSVAAVGLGVPAPVDHRTGQEASAPQLPGWSTYDVPGHLQRALDVPVLVDNDVTIMALGERAVGWHGVEHFVFVKVATGIGAGIISGGTLLRGDQGLAGHIGHLPLTRAGDIRCPCGQRGCLTAVASGGAIATALRSAGLAVENSADVADLVLAGDAQAVAAVRQAGVDLGEILVACTGFLNPSVIVVGGSLARCGEVLLEPVRTTLAARAMTLATRDLQVAATQAGDDAGVIGAALMAVEHLVSPAGVRALLR